VTLQSVLRLCLFCDYSNCSSIPQANHNFPDFSQFSLTFPWPMSNSSLFQVFHVGSHPARENLLRVLLDAATVARPNQQNQNTEETFSQSESVNNFIKPTNTWRKLQTCKWNSLPNLVTQSSIHHSCRLSNNIWKLLFIWSSIWISFGCICDSTSVHSANCHRFHLQLLKLCSKDVKRLSINR